MTCPYGHPVEFQGLEENEDWDSSMPIDELWWCEECGQHYNQWRIVEDEVDDLGGES